MASWLSLDVSGARVFRLLDDAEDDPEAVSKETRLSAALGFGPNTGASLGASFVDYGGVRALLGTLAIRWGARAP